MTEELEGEQEQQSEAEAEAVDLSADLTADDFTRWRTQVLDALLDMRDVAEEILVLAKRSEATPKRKAKKAKKRTTRR